MYYCFAMMNVLKSIGKLFGFNKDTKYVRRHLSEANVRGAVFMAAIIILLEIWMIFRQTDKYIIPRWDRYGFSGIFRYTSGFFLFLFVGLSVFVYSLCHQLPAMKRKTRFILNACFSGATIAYSFLIFIENFSPWDSFSNQLSNSLLIVTYIFAFLVGAAVLVDAIIRYRTGKYYLGLMIGVMGAFALMCVAFGVKVSYGDFISTSSLMGGNDTNHKEIICFLTMMLFASCLLIWKPYVSILTNVGIFVVFMILLKDSPVTAEFAFKEGDEVNYITFLVAMTTVCISIYHQRRAEAIKDEELEYLANYDELTGLYNFAYFARCVGEADTRENKVLLFINVLHFQPYNDQRGFVEGNRFLKKLGRTIKDMFPENIVCRQSDDHFMAFVSEKDYESRLDSLDVAVKALDPEAAPLLQIGIYSPREDEEIHRACDKARYACNSLGSDLLRRRAVYDKAMGEAFHLMQHVIRNIDNAVKLRWIRPYYQPVVWSKDGTLCGVEALARWQDPRYGFLAPGKFVPTLETTKLVHKLDACVLESVCRDIRRCLDEGLPVVPVSINFSRLDFELMDIVSYLEEVVALYSIPKDFLHVEITESALAEDEGLLSSNAQKLKQKGYALWLDDFGSGYSSLNVLKDFDFDVMKIDMKFLAGFEGNPKAQPLLESVIDMAERMGMRTLSEGVETIPEKDFLKKSNCERMQGFLFSKPISFEELQEKIKQGEFTVSKELV